MDSYKPAVLIFGGCGFIGRHIVAELVDNNAASLVRVVDKVPPQIAWMNLYHKAVFENASVEFKSANLINPVSCDAAFGEENFDWVINAAGETKTGQEDAVYQEGIVKVSTNCANAAAKHQVKVYVEISDSHMTSTGKEAFQEERQCEPWTSVSKFKYDSEKIIRNIPGLNWIIVRPAMVYGPGDKLGLTPRLLVGAVYRYLGETMKLLWDAKLRINTIHVVDVARAIIWLCKRGHTSQIYNLVDEGDTTQGDITNIIADIFGIKCDYWGNTISNIAKIDLSTLVEEVNEKHLSPWAKLCAEGNVSNTPLTPYLDRDALHKYPLHLSGAKLHKDGFSFLHPKMTKELAVKVLEDFIDMKIFPKQAFS